MMRWKNVLLLVAIFLCGLVAGVGIGNLYGGNAYNAQLEQKVTDLQNRYQNVNDNYMTLVREYNKLFSLKSSTADTSTAAVTAPVAPKPTTAPAQAPAASPTVAKPASTAIVPATSAATKPTVAATAPAASGKPKPDFKAEAIGGTGPLEGAPPLLVKFSDLSSGTITSWKWEFGDGETSTDKNPEHTYRDCPGDKKLCTVKLTVCGPDGCTTATKPDYLWVSESCTGC